MRSRTWWLSSLVFVAVGCQPAQQGPEPERTPSLVEAERLASERGFHPGEVTVVPTRDEGGAERHTLHFDGVPVWGISAKTAEGLTRMPDVRFAPDQAVETRPQLSAAQAETIALDALKDPTATIDESRLVLLPREEQRLKADAPTRFAGRRNADHFERVVTGMTLIYRLVLTTQDPERGERTWAVGVDARSGRVLWADPLAVDIVGNPVYRKVAALGKYAGAFTFNTLYEDAQYVLEDQRGNTYHTQTGGGRTDPIVVYDYVSADNRFGDGQFYVPGNSFLSANGETAAVDAQYAVNMSWVVYEQLLGRTGPGARYFDIRVHLPLANAEYGPSTRTPLLNIGYRVYPGTGSRAPLSTTDAVGHEIGHDFFMREVAGTPTSFPSERSELRGMNEGAGDVMGFLTEMVRDGAKSGLPATSIDQVPLKGSNLTIVEETGLAGRNLLTPEEPEWFQDIGTFEEHAAGGPLARMFLLLAYGCQAVALPANPWQCARVPLGFTGVGPARAARLFGKAVELLPMGSGYSDMRDAALAAATSIEGIPGGTLRRATGSAFAAINVGAPSDNNPPTATLTCRQIDQNIDCTGLITDAETPNQGDQLPQLKLDSGTPVSILNWNFHEVFLGGPLASGNHTVTLTAWDLWHNQVTRTVTVALDKTGPTATVTRTGPPKQPLLHVDASDTAGIKRVDFYDGTQFRVGIMAPPFENMFDTSTWSDGTHAMVIKVYDAFENVTVLNYALVVDNILPSASMTVGSGAPPFNVNLTVSDASAIARVDFKVDGIVFATRTNSATTYQAAYSPSDPLAHNLIAEVTDVFGNKGTTTIGAPRDLTPPTVTFAASQLGATVTLTTNVSDTCGFQTPYSLLVDGTVVAQPTTPGYVLTFGASMADGTHLFQAVVQDQCGNTANFQTTFVKGLTPPVITGIVRDDTVPKKPKFTVQCTDTEGVHHVEMRENGVIIASDSTAPYEFVVDTTGRADGSYTFLFQCSDINGAASTPETRTVTADNTGPTFSFTIYGAGRSYFVSAGTVADAHAIQSIVLTGGVIPGFSVTLTQVPWSYTWNIPGTTVIQTDLPFSITAKDAWGNTSSQSRICTVNTNSTTPAFLSCH